MTAKPYLALAASSLILLPGSLAAQQAPSLSLSQFERFIHNEISEPGLMTRIGEMCPDFMATDAAVVQRLRALNVSDRVLQALTDRRLRCAPPPPPLMSDSATIVLRMATPGQAGGTRFPNRERVLVIGARGDTLTRLTTDTLGWTAPLSLSVGQYTINAQHADSAARLRYEWRVPFAALGGRSDTLLLASHNVADKVSLEPPRRVDSTFSVRQLVTRARGSLLAVQGREQHGSAIVLDTAGVDSRLLYLATSHRLVRDASDIRVTVNDTLRLKAHLLAGDSATDVAVLVVSRARCAGCRPVRLSDSTASAQDEIVVIGAHAYREGRNVQQALVQDVAANRIVINQMLDSTANGGGVFDAHGRVVALWTTQTAGGRRDFSVAVPARQLAAARDAALKRRAAVPYDQPLPIAPRRAFPEAAVKSAVTTNDPNLKPFVFTTGEFKVMIMTPQLAAWRQKRAEAELSEKKKSFKPSDPDMIDPIEVWPGWKEYLTSRKPLVIVQVAPKDAGFPSYDVNETITRAKADVWEVTLKRDTSVVEPVDRALVPAMVRHAAARARGVAPARQAILLYRISDFRLNDDGSYPFMQFAITDSKNPGAHFPLNLTPQTIDALNTAFRVWLNSADRAATR